MLLWKVGLQLCNSIKRTHEKPYKVQSYNTYTIRRQCPLRTFMYAMPNAICRPFCGVLWPLVSQMYRNRDIKTRWHWEKLWLRSSLFASHLDLVSCAWFKHHTYIQSMMQTNHLHIPKICSAHECSKASMRKSQFGNNVWPPNTSDQPEAHCWLSSDSNCIAIWMRQS